MSGILKEMGGQLVTDGPLDRDKLKMVAILTNYLCPNNEKKYKTLK